MARFDRAGTGLGALAGLALVLPLVGCGGPPPSSTSRAARGNVVREGRKPHEVVPIPRTDKVAAEALRSGALMQAGLETAALQFADPAPGEQAKAVREAIRRQPPAVIVEAPAGADADLDAAVAEARSKGILVVALGRPLGGASSGPGREVVVAPAPFQATADRLAELAMRNATNGKLDPRAGALVVVKSDADSFAPDRAAALRQALEAAGVAKVEELAVSGGPNAQKEAVAEAVKARASVTIVLAADGASLTAADHATGILKADRPFIVAGYADDESSARNQTKSGEYAAAAIYAHDRLFRKGVYVAARVLRGEAPAERVEIESPLLESPADAARPRARVEPPPRESAPESQ